MTQPASEKSNKPGKGKIILVGVLGVAFVVVLLLPDKKSDPPPPAAGAKRRRPTVRRGAGAQQAKAAVAGPTKSAKPLPAVKLKDVIAYNPFEADGKSAASRHRVQAAKKVRKPLVAMRPATRTTPNPLRDKLIREKVDLVMRTKNGVTIVSGNKVIHLGRDDARGVILHKVDEQGADIEFLPRKKPATSGERE